MVSFKHLPCLLILIIGSIFFSGCTVGRKSTKNKALSKFRHNRFNPDDPSYGADIYHTITIGAGTTPLQVKGFSPSVSYQYQQIDVNTNQQTMGTYRHSVAINSVSGFSSTIHGGLEIGRKDWFFGEFNVGALQGQGSNYFLTLGGGYNFTIPDQNIITFRPSVSYYYSESDIRFSDGIDNYYKDIVAFDQKFSYVAYHNTKSGSHTEYIKTLNTKIKNYGEGMKLKIGFWFFPESDFVLRLNAGYNLPVYQNMKVEIYSNAGSDKIDLDDPRLNYNSHTSTPSNKAFQYGGFFGNAEVGIKF
jgi:hypothetical protein